MRGVLPSMSAKRTLVTIVVAAGVLAAAGTASANQPSVIAYNGHAGLGAPAYQLAVTDGTSNTISFGEFTAPASRPVR